MNVAPNFQKVDNSDGISYLTTHGSVTIFNFPSVYSQHLWIFFVKKEHLALLPHTKETNEKAVGFLKQTKNLSLVLFKLTRTTGKKDEKGF